MKVFIFFSPLSLHPFECSFNALIVDTSMDSAPTKPKLVSEHNAAFLVAYTGKSKTAPLERYTHVECSRFHWSFNFMHLDTDSCTHTLLVTSNEI